MNNRLIKMLISALLLSLTACETGIFVRKPHYYDHHPHVVNWGYTTGDPMLDAGYYGNFYPQAVYQSEGAISH